MKKKLIMVLIAMGMVCSLPACGVSENGKGTEKTSILKKDDFKMLLTGDIEKKAEDNILKNRDVREELKNMTVLKAAHHGSASSSGEEFIKLVNPEVTVISCGINNRYGHPKESTLEILKKNNSDIYVTKECGQVMIRYTKDKFYVKTL